MLPASLLDARRRWQSFVEDIDGLVAGEGVAEVTDDGVAVIGDAAARAVAGPAPVDELPKKVLLTLTPAAAVVEEAAAQAPAAADRLVAGERTSHDCQRAPASFRMPPPWSARPLAMVSRATVTAAPPPTSKTRPIPLPLTVSSLSPGPSMSRSLPIVRLSAGVELDGLALEAVGEVDRVTASGGRDSRPQGPAAIVEVV